MSKRDEFITFINEIKSMFPSISEEQRKELLRGAVQQYNITVDVAVDILEASGLAVGEQVDYFQVLDLSISEFENRNESDIIHHVETAHKKLYVESLQAGGRPRADGKSEAEWRTVLNNARDILVDVHKRKAYIDRLENSVSSTKELVSDKEILTLEETATKSRTHCR